jgi:uncharacterized protein YndB with AHSA1/START domain
MIGFETSACIRLPIEDVFAYVADPLNLPQWNSAVQTVRKSSVGGNDAASTYSMERELPGGRAVSELEIVAREPPHEFVIRTTAGPTPFLYHYRFTGENGETVITLDAQLELPGAAALLPRLAQRMVKKGVDDNLAALKHILEARLQARLSGGAGARHAARG